MPDQDWRSGPGCETGPIIPHPTKRNIVYGSCKGQYEVMNLETGQAKPYWVGAQSLYGNPARDLILRFQRVSPMEVSPHDPDVLYYGSQHVHRTRDLGATWETISPDLTAKPECCQGISGEPTTRDITGEEFYSTLYSIRESLREPGVIWVGANDGPFHVTRDNGRNWTNITPKDLPSGGRVQFIEPSPHRGGSAYYAVHRFLLGDYQPYKVVDRVQQAQGRLRNATGAEAETAKQLQAIADRLFTPPIRYSKPGLQAHISYLNGMTSGVDQKPGRDALERYTVLRRELDAMKAEVDRVLGAGG